MTDRLRKTIQRNFSTTGISSGRLVFAVDPLCRVYLDRVQINAGFFLGGVGHKSKQQPHPQ